jgi:hypothetical protein
MPQEGSQDCLKSSSRRPTSFEDKKLDIIGWKGPKAAVQAIKDASKSFKKLSWQRG